MAFNFDQSGKNHPGDFRNMLIFVLAAIAIWFAFDHFVMKPRSEAAKHVLSQDQLKGAGTQVSLKPRAEVLAATSVNGGRIVIDAPEIIGSVPTTGIRFDDIVLKHFYTALDNKEPVVLLSPPGTDHPHYADIGWLADAPAVKVPDKATRWTVTSKGPLSLANPLTMSWDNGGGLRFTRKISVDTHFMFTVDQGVTNTGSEAVKLYPYSTVARRGFPVHEKGPGYEGPLGYIGDEMQETSYSEVVKKKEISYAGVTGWIGFGDKYWLSALVPDQAETQTFRFSAVPDLDKDKTLYQVDVRGEPVTAAPGTTVQSVSHLYVGAKQVKLLDSYEDALNIRHFELAVDFGSLYFLTRPLYFLLNLFNSWVGNFGIAILMLTLTVRTAVFPLTNASYKSFAKLRKVSPKMAELKVKYGSDKARMQQELVKLYETERVNPMAGCFPLILQIPIFFAVYKVISISIEMRHAPFYGWIRDLSARDPLSVFNLFGLIHFDVPAVLQIGPWSIAMLILMLAQKKLNPPPQDQIQKDMANYMPWVITFMLSSFPSGLVIYWTFSNLISVLQQSMIMRMMGVPVYLFSPDKALAYAESQSQSVAEATQRAKNEIEAAKKKAEPVKEALFDDSKPVS